MNERLMGLILTGLWPALAFGAGNNLLRLVQRFPMPGVHGKFDHLAVDLAGHRLFVAAEDQPAIEVLDLQTGNRLAEIRAVGKPHAIFFMPRRDWLFVTDGRAGECKIFDGRTYRLIKAIKLQVDSDSGYYDAASHRLFVVNGGSDAGKPYSFISIINTEASADVKNIEVPDNGPEAVRLGGSGRLYVNLNGDNQVGVLDLASGRLLAQWGLGGAKDNVPMDIDRADHRLFVVTRKPPKLLVYDTRTGKIVASLASDREADDMIYDAEDKLILVSCGQGFVYAYRQLGPNQYALAAKVPSGPAAKTSVFVPSLHRLYVAAAARGSEPARILVYRVQ